MKRTHIWTIVVALTILALIFGAFSAESPLIQYLGNTTGVLLGFLLAVAWQEEDKRRAKQESVALFWKEFHEFHLWLDRQSTYLRTQASGCIFDNVFEGRLPVIEANQLLRRAGDLELDADFRKQLAGLVDEIRVIDDYINLGADKLNKYRMNFCTKIDILKEHATKMKCLVK